VVRIAAATVLLALGIAASVGACTLLGDDPPVNTCKADADCFTDIEQCNLDKKVCEPKPDAGP
jgi:hypothetical protein